jgi:hypothetical protein
MLDRPWLWPPIGEPLQTGDSVSVTCDGRTVGGYVRIASPNGRSLIVAFEALLDGHAGYMPLLQRDDGSYEALITGTLVGVKRKPKE